MFFPCTLPFFFCVIEHTQTNTQREKKRRDGKERDKEGNTVFSAWKDEFLALDAAADVKVKEVAVEEGLDGAKDPDEPCRVSGLGEGAVDPVADVEGAVEAEAEDVVCGEVLDLAALLEEVDLRDDGDGLEDDREGPEDLHGAVAAGEDEAEDERGRDEVPDDKVVARVVVRGAELLRDEVDRVARAREEHDLQDRVVQREVVREHVQVPRHKHNHVDDLCLQRDARHVLVSDDLLQKDDVAQQMNQICKNTKVIKHCHGGWGMGYGEEKRTRNQSVNQSISHGKEKRRKPKTKKQKKQKLATKTHQEDEIEIERKRWRWMKKEQNNTQRLNLKEEYHRRAQRGRDAGRPGRG